MTGEPRRALLFVAWGDAFVQEVLDCIAGSELPRVPLYLLTDETSHVPDGAPLQVIRTSFRLHGKLRLPCCQPCLLCGRLHHLYGRLHLLLRLRPSVRQPHRQRHRLRARDKKFL